MFVQWPCVLYVKNLRSNGWTWEFRTQKPETDIHIDVLLEMVAEFFNVDLEEKLKHKENPTFVNHKFNYNMNKRDSKWNKITYLLHISIHLYFFVFHNN